MGCELGVDGFDGVGERTEGDGFRAGLSTSRRYTLLIFRKYEVISSRGVLQASERGTDFKFHAP